MSNRCALEPEIQGPDLQIPPMSTPHSMKNCIKARRCEKGGVLFLRFCDKTAMTLLTRGTNHPSTLAALRHQAGGDRQDLHEKIRVHSMAAGMAVKGEGKPNDLMDRVAGDPAFEAVHGDKLASLIDPALFIGRSPEQVYAYTFLSRCS